MLTLTDISLNKHITPIVEAVLQTTFAARKIAPVVPVDDSEFAYRVWNKEHLRYIDTRVGERGKAKPLDHGMEWEEDKTISHAGEIFIPEKILKKGAKAAINFAMEEAELAAQTFNIEEEYVLADWMTDSSGGNFSNRDTPATKWDATDGDPAGDISGKIQTVAEEIGVLPNSLIMTPDVFRELATNHARSVGDHQPTAQEQAILNYIAADCLKNCIVTNAIYNEAETTGDEDLTSVWGSEFLWLAYIHPTPSRSAPSFAGTFENKGGTFTDGEMSKNPRGQYVYIHRDYRTKIRNETAAFCFYSVLS